MGAVPELDRNFWIDRANLEAIQRSIRIADETGRPQSIGLWGSIATGKTTLGIQIGAIRGAPTFHFNPSNITYAVLHGGAYRPSMFMEAIETENAVVVVDDLILESDIAELLLPLLDETVHHQVHVGKLDRILRVARGVMIVVMWNPAYNLERGPVTAMLMDRLGIKIELRTR